MRVYLAATRERLRAVAEGSDGADGWAGFAALESVRAELGGLGDEELEYALTVAAGEASAALGPSGDGGRGHGGRLVIVAEVDEAVVTSDPDVPGAVVVRGPIALSDVDAILSDDGQGADDELGWFGVQEIADLLA
jgi:Family of unknown function (DUF6912)